MDRKRRVALQILEKIEQAGYAAYLVGGCVRDLVLGIESKDYDICTNAEPHIIQQLFEYTIPTGLKHGTVTVVEQNIPYEVTTFRKEGNYVGYRRPSQVSYVSKLETDLSRRDFTMNAMAQDRHGKIYDPFGGRKDIQNRRIRCVGNPFERFSEDALRMIRAARFAAQFHFSIDYEVGKAIDAYKDRVEHLAVERVVAEMEKIWNSKTPSVGLKVFWQFDLWSHLPVFRHWLWKEVSEQEILAFDWLKDSIVCWSFLFHLGQIDRANAPRECRELTLSKVMTTNILDCIRLADQWKQSVAEEQLKHYLLEYGVPTTYRAYQFMSLRQLRRPSPSMEEVLQTLWRKMPARSISELAIGGNDLLHRISPKAGPWVGQTLQHLLVRVALGQIPNEEQILLKEASKFAEKILSPQD